MHATMGDQCLIYNTNLIRIKVATIITYVTAKMYLCILTQATIKCAFLRDIKVILLLLILSGNPNRFLDLKSYHSLEHAETKKYIVLFIVKGNQ